MKEKQYKKLIRLSATQPGLRYQSFISFPCPWITTASKSKLVEYTKRYGFPNHREIFNHEIVIDVDADNKKDGMFHADRLEERLIKYNFYYERWVSGGTGEHFHLFFDKKKMLSLISEKNTIGDIRKTLIKYIVGEELMLPDDLESHICMYNKKLIQIENEIHRKGGMKILKSRKDGTNGLPEILVGKVKKITKKKREISRDLNLYKAISTPCIKFFSGEIINNIDYFKEDRLNYRTIFLMASYFFRKTKDKTKATKLMLEWYRSIPNKMRKSSLSTTNEYHCKNTVAYTNGSASCFYAYDLLDNLQCTNVCKGCPLAVTNKK